MTTPSFSIKGLRFPTITAHFRRIPSDLKFTTAFRTNVVIKDDRNIRVLFGVRVFSNEVVSDAPGTDIIIEAIGHFEMNEPLGAIKKLTDIPLLANMYAFMFPFMREKVNYCSTSNEIGIFLDPVNTNQLISDWEGSSSFGLQDKRNAGSDKPSSTSENPASGND